MVCCCVSRQRLFIVASLASFAKTTSLRCQVDGYKDDAVWTHVTKIANDTQLEESATSRGHALLSQSENEAAHSEVAAATRPDDKIKPVPPTSWVFPEEAAEKAKLDDKLAAMQSAFNRKGDATGASKESLDRRMRARRGSRRAPTTGETWSSGHKIIYMRHAMSVNNNFGNGWDLRRLYKGYRAATDSCQDTCACLPYFADDAGELNGSSCSEQGEWRNQLRDCLLSPYGEKRAMKIGWQVRRVLDANNITVQKFLVSPARRTLQTLLVLFRHLISTNVEVVPHLHEALLSRSDLAYDGETAWRFLQALQKHFKDGDRSVVSDSTMAEFKGQLTNENYTEELQASYDIADDGNPVHEKVKEKTSEGHQISFTRFFHKRMAILRKKLLAMPLGTYVIISHGGIGQYFFPGRKLLNLGVIIGDLNGNENSEKIFHNYTTASEVWQNGFAGFGRQKLKLPGWRSS